MLDSKSCRHSWKWEGRFRCKRWSFSLCYCTKITSFWTTITRNKADIWKWQKPWNNCTGNKLQSINPTIPTIGVYQHVRSLSRRDAVIIDRLRIGHTRLTRSYLFALINRSHCPLTVKHILIECPALTRSRSKHFTASSLKDLFDNVAARNIINYQRIPFL